MRVITGKFKGRKLEAPGGFRTRPMGDRIKMALFNTIQSELTGARVLDAYGGSGALGIEALSRGAAFVQVIESDQRASAVIRANFERLGADPDTYKLSHATCATWCKNHNDQQFEVILVDPPFDQLNLSTVSKLGKLLTPNGLMVLSHSGREAEPTAKGVVVVDNRVYGDAALSYYRKADQRRRSSRKN